MNKETLDTANTLNAQIEQIKESIELLAYNTYYTKATTLLETSCIQHPCMEYKNANRMDSKDIPNKINKEFILFLTEALTTTLKELENTFDRL